MRKAKDIMTKEVITVAPETTVEELARILIQHGISGAPVLDKGGRLTGVVTENDLIGKNTRLHIPTVLRLFDAYIPLGTSRLEAEIKRVAALTVGEVCSRDVITVDEESSIEYLATLMTEKNIHLLPVVKEGKICGIIGKRDVIKSMTEEY